MLDLKQLRQLIKDSIDQEKAEGVLSSIGYHIGRDHKFMLREENTASTSIRDDGYLTDFGDGWSGDIVALLHEKRGMSLPDATLFTAEQLGISTDTFSPAPIMINPVKRKPAPQKSYDLEAIHNRFITDLSRADRSIIRKQSNELISYDFFRSCAYPSQIKGLFGYSSKDESITIHLSDKEQVQTIAIRRSKDRNGKPVKWKTFGSKTFIPFEINDDFIFFFSGMAEILIMKMLGLSFVMLQADGMIRHLPIELKELCRDKTIIVLQDNDNSFRSIVSKIESFFNESEVLIIDFEKLLGRELNHGYDFRDFCNEIKDAKKVMDLIEEEIIRLQEAMYVRAC